MKRRKVLEREREREREALVAYEPVNSSLSTTNSKDTKEGTTYELVILIHSIGGEMMMTPPCPPSLPHSLDLLDVIF